MSAPEIDNRTDFAVAPYVLLDKDGELLVTMVKATFVHSGDGRLVPAPRAQQRALRFIDEPWGDPATSPPQYPCDACGYKPGTDVVIVAKGYAPDGKAVPSFEVGAQIGPLRKQLRIFGLRVWQDNGAGLSAPRPVQSQEIRYDWAWGGIDTSDMSHIVEEPTNPTGRGIARDLSSLTHQPAPCIEDPAHPIRSASGRNVPAGFGALGPHFAPRRGYQGTIDEAWHREQAPLLPRDRDDRANHCGSEGLIATPPLTGREQVNLMNLTPGGGLVQLMLPGVAVSVTHHHAHKEPVSSSPHLDTIVIDTLQPNSPSDVTVELIWRSVTAVPRQLARSRIAIAQHDAASGGAGGMAI